MTEFYPRIKWGYISCVLAIGLLFARPELLVQLGCSGVAQQLPVRLLGYMFDATLMNAVLMFLSIVPGAMLADGWLVTSLLLLVGNVALGVLALRRAREPVIQPSFSIAALVTYTHMPGVARMHHPLGWLHGWIA